MDFKERPEGSKDYAEVEIVTERDNHRAILLGAGGAALKRLAIASRAGIEAFTGEFNILFYILFLEPGLAGGMGKANEQLLYKDQGFGLVSCRLQGNRAVFEMQLSSGMVLISVRSHHWDSWRIYFWWMCIYLSCCVCAPGKPIYLNISVKVSKNWRKDAKLVEDFGY